MAKHEKKNDLKEPFYQRFLRNERFTRGGNFLWDNRIEIFASILMFAGLVLSFFYHLVGGFLVGLACGIAFFDEIYEYFLLIRDSYISKGLFKTLMWIGTILYFLIAIPAFVIAAVIGFGVIFLIRWSFSK
jgi:hypothetical protein